MTAPIGEPGAAAYPPFVGNLARNADYYRLEFLDDGFPGRRTDGELKAHPIYGAYVLKDYVEQHAVRPDPHLRDALRRVADAAIARMQDHDGALVFWYDADAAVSRSDSRHYSGLTQGYYAVYLCKAAQILDSDRLRRVADRVFDSLMVPAERGGVLYPGSRGPTIAELPQRPNSLILNGWQSALACVSDYAELSRRPEAERLLQDSAREMERLLPLYDHLDLRNSRYGLSGFAYVRVVLRRAERAAVAFRDLAVDASPEGIEPVPARQAGRWRNFLFPADVTAQGGDQWVVPVGNVLRANVVLTRATFPRPNRLEFLVRACEGATLEVQLQVGRYDPTTASPADGQWRTIATVDAPAGEARVSVAIPWEQADLVAYPTNFAKRIDGKRVNIYHVIHVQRLTQLAERTGSSGLGHWARRWSGYMSEWRYIPAYAGYHVRSGGGVAAVEELPVAGCAPVRSVPP